MLSLMCNLMLRRRMVPRGEGVRLHFIVNQAAWLFSAIAASSNPTLNRSAEAKYVHLFKSFGPRPVSFALGLSPCLRHCLNSLSGSWWSLCSTRSCMVSGGSCSRQLLLVAIRHRDPMSIVMSLSRYSLSRSYSSGSRLPSPSPLLIGASNAPTNE
jgi:hypothetical protein